jgi:hypothetical protein
MSKTAPIKSTAKNNGKANANGSARLGFEAQPRAAAGEATPDVNFSANFHDEDSNSFRRTLLQ